MSVYIKQRGIVAACAFFLAVAANILLFDMHQPSLGFASYIFFAFWGITLAASLTKQLHQPKALFLGIPLFMFAYAILNYNNEFVADLVPLLSIVFLLIMTLLLTAKPGEKPARGFLDFVAVQQPFLWLKQVSVFFADLKKGFSDRASMSKRVHKVLIGLLISIPLLVIFLILFSQADAIFAQTVNKLPLGQLHLDRIVHIAALTVLVAALGYFFISPEHGVKSRALKTKHVDNTIVSTVFASLNVLFLLFNAIQVKYLFSGAQYVFDASITFAEYARKGFFDLLGVMCIAAVLVFVVMRLLHKDNRTNMLRFFTTFFVAQLGVIAVSAIYRLNLYQDAFGYTTARLFGEWAVYGIIVLLLGAIFALVLKWSFDKLLRYSYVVVLVGLSTVSLINIDFVIAEKNISRELSGISTRELDTRYLLTLSIDAMPAYDALLVTSKGRTDKVRRTIVRECTRVTDRVEQWNKWQAINFGLLRAKNSAAYQSCDTREALLY